MVNKQVGRDFEYQTVHRKQKPFTIFGEDHADSVKVSVPSISVPFMFRQMPVIVGVNDGIFALRQRYAAEGIAVANAAIEEHGQCNDALKPSRNSDNDFDCPLPRWITEDRSQMSENRIL